MYKRVAATPQPRHHMIVPMPAIAPEALEVAAEIGRKAIEHARECRLSEGVVFDVEHYTTIDKTTLMTALGRLYGDDSDLGVGIVGTDGRSSSFMTMQSY